MMDESRTRSKGGLLFKMAVFVAIPLVAGIAGGFALHRYQAGQIVEDFEPYKTVVNESSQGSAQRHAYAYIATETDRKFGEIENFKSYRSDWEIVNSGLKPLELEMVSQTCQVLFEGQPFESKQTIPGQSLAKVTMIWIETASEGNFSQEFNLKTNDDFAERRNLRFHVYGTINPALRLSPKLLDFGELTPGETKELTARIECFRTKNFKLEGFTLSDEAARGGFDVKFVPVENPANQVGDRSVNSAVDIVVTAKAETLEKKKHDLSLAIDCNLPQIEGLVIAIKAVVQ